MRVCVCVCVSASVCARARVRVCVRDCARARARQREREGAGREREGERERERERTISESHLTLAWFSKEIQHTTACHPREQTDLSMSMNCLPSQTDRKRQKRVDSSALGPRQRRGGVTEGE